MALNLFVLDAAGKYVEEVLSFQKDTLESRLKFLKQCDENKDYPVKFFEKWQLEGHLNTLKIYKVGRASCDSSYVYSAPRSGKSSVLRDAPIFDIGRHGHFNYVGETNGHANGRRRNFSESAAGSSLDGNTRSSASSSPSTMQGGDGDRNPNPENIASIAEVKNKKSSSENRHVHNTLEKNRRAHLRLMFTRLREILGKKDDTKKISNLLILQSAIDISKTLTSHEEELLQEKDKLQREQELLLQRLRQLQLEISEQHGTQPPASVIALVPGLISNEQDSCSTTTTADEGGDPSELDDPEVMTVAVPHSDQQNKKGGYKPKTAAKRKSPDRGVASSKMKKLSPESMQNWHSAQQGRGMATNAILKTIDSNSTSHPTTTMVHAASMQLTPISTMGTLGGLASQTVVTPTGAIQAVIPHSVVSSANIHMPHQTVMVQTGSPVLIAGLPDGSVPTNGKTNKIAALSVQPNTFSAVPRPSSTIVRSVNPATVGIPGLTQVMTPLPCQGAPIVPQYILTPQALGGKVVTPLMKPISLVGTQIVSIQASPSKQSTERPNFDQKE